MDFSKAFCQLLATLRVSEQAMAGAMAVSTREVFRYTRSKVCPWGQNEAHDLLGLVIMEWPHTKQAVNGFLREIGFAQVPELSYTETVSVPLLSKEEIRRAVEQLPAKFRDPCPKCGGTLIVEQDTLTKVLDFTCINCGKILSQRLRRPTRCTVLI